LQGSDREVEGVGSARGPERKNSEVGAFGVRIASDIGDGPVLRHREIAEATELRDDGAGVVMPLLPPATL